MGESDRAIEHYQLRLSIAREIGDRRGEGEGLWNMSVVLRKLGNLQEAIKHAEASLKIYEQIEDPNAATVRKQLGIWKKRLTSEPDRNTWTPYGVPTRNSYRIYLDKS